MPIQSNQKSKTKNINNIHACKIWKKLDNSNLNTLYFDTTLNLNV